MSVSAQPWPSHGNPAKSGRARWRANSELAYSEHDTESAVVVDCRVPRWVAPTTATAKTVLPETPATPLTSGRRGRGMASNGTSYNGSSAFSLVDDPTNDSSVFGDKPALQRVRDVVGDSEAALARAGAAVARVECEIDHLWRDSMMGDDRATSERLAEVGHALHRAALLMKRDDAIG